VGVGCFVGDCEELGKGDGDGLAIGLDVGVGLGWLD